MTVLSISEEYHEIMFCNSSLRTQNEIFGEEDRYISPHSVEVQGLL